MTGTRSIPLRGMRSSRKGMVPLASLVDEVGKGSQKLKMMAYQQQVKDSEENGPPTHTTACYLLKKIYIIDQQKRLSWAKKHRPSTNFPFYPCPHRVASYCKHVNTNKKRNLPSMQIEEENKESTSQADKILQNKKKQSKLTILPIWIF